MANPFDDGFSSTVSVLGILLIAAGALSFFSIKIPASGAITAGLLALGGILAFFNSFRIWGNMNAGASIVMLLLTLIITIMGVSGFYAIPFVSGLVAYIPAGAITTALAGLILIIDAGMSTT